MSEDARRQHQASAIRGMQTSAREGLAESVVATREHHELWIDSSDLKRQAPMTAARIDGLVDGSHGLGHGDGVYVNAENS